MSLKSHHIIFPLYPRLADIAGFGSWASSRDPVLVFTLLETVYAAFDAIARNRRVYSKYRSLSLFFLTLEVNSKIFFNVSFVEIEAHGDSYVACAGLPTPRSDHALTMAKYARDCLSAFGRVTEQLERSLGPDTGDLSIRVGLHSGPVIAGVLRGERVSKYNLKNAKAAAF